MTTEPKPKPFNIKLSEGDRAALERVRIALGERSHADTIRRLIRNYVDPNPRDPQRLMAYPSGQGPHGDGLPGQPAHAPPEAPRFNIQIGPVARKPGSMLKGAKK